jgi:Tol biopolymer transport system component
MIAFARRLPGNSEIYVMDANGNGQRNLTRTPTRNEDNHWAWSPTRTK